MNLAKLGSVLVLVASVCACGSAPAAGASAAATPQTPTASEAIATRAPCDAPLEREPPVVKRSHLGMCRE
jgi:hypothetical protein